MTTHGPRLVVQAIVRGLKMRRAFERVWWMLRLWLVRFRARLLRQDERADVVFVGLKAGRRGHFGVFLRAIDLVGGLAGWDAATKATAAGTYYDAEELSEAANLFAAALEESPEDPIILSNYGWYLFKNGDYEESLRYLKRALSFCPNDPWIMAWIGGCHFRLENMEEARRWYSQCLENDPDLTDVGYVYSHLGHVAARTGHWEEAIRYWREAATHLPRDEEIWYNLGDALLQAGQYKEAIDALEKNLRFGSEKPAWTYYDLACCYQQLGDFVQARRLCDEALRHAPDDEDALNLNRELEAVPGESSRGTSQ